MKVSHQPKAPTQVAWRSRQWCDEIGGISPAQFYEWVKDGTIKTVKVGGMRLVTESPAAFIQRHLNAPAKTPEQPEAEAA